MITEPLHPLLAAIPARAEKPIKLRVSNSAESNLRRGHPWLFNERIQSESHAGQAGDLAVVFDRKREFLALGLYDPHSPIRMRALRFHKPGPVDCAFFAERIATALARRQALLATETDGYRMIHGESDGMPGFVADRYADTAVVKLYSHAWIPHLHTCLTSLLTQQPFARVVLRLSRQLSAQPESLYGLDDGLLLTGILPDQPLTFLENGLRFEVDPVHGQKTGFFLDQRDNRARVETLAEGCRVLNVFSYNGGFSLYAARGGAREVWSLDQSRPALEAAERCFHLNRNFPGVAAAGHELVEGDAFQQLSKLAQRGEQFDLIIIDPPSFARRRAQVEGALEAYARLTRLGLALLRPGGRIVLASCSNPVHPDAFRQTVCAAAARVGRPLRELEETNHAIDHPLDFVESRYLKCLFAKA